MSTLAPQTVLRQIGLMQPPMRKGSYSFIVCPNPIVDGFVCGPENAAVAECFHPDAISLLESRSPLVLSGPSGTGKTSVAATLAALWMNDGLQRKITFTSGMEFSRALVRAIKADDMSRFRQVHRDCDCLVIDNAHELTGKQSAQEELITTLDHLELNQKLVVITATEIPHLLQGLDVGLLSRLSAGHSVLFKHPGSQAKRRILQLAADELTQSIGAADLDRFAAQLPEVHTAMQVRAALLRWSHQLRSDPSEPLAGPKALGRMIEAPLAPNVSPHEIAKIVARELKISVETLVGPLRKSSVVRARGLAMILMRQLTSESYESIGAYFSNRDHTTVMHACKKTEIDLKTDTELSRIHDRIRQRFQRTG
jgi:chromosomal replication initiator protein